MRAKHGKREITLSHKRTFKKLAKILFSIVVGISSVIVLTFLFYKLLAKEPTIQTPITTNEPVGSTTTNLPKPSSMQPDEGDRKLERKLRCYTFLLVATDQVGGNADTIMVAMYDTVAQKVGLVSIPRDTLVDAPYPKINSLYSSGIGTLQASVSDILGIPIDFYVAIDLAGFVELVDTIGGIDFDVPIHMSYDAPDQNLHIHFEPGVQHLDGQAALEVCRLRKNSDNTVAYPDSDIGRTRTQQRLLTAIGKKALANPQNLASYVDIFLDNVKTDLDTRELLWFIEPITQFNIEAGLNTATLPGDGEVKYKGVTWCYQLYPEDVLDIVNKMINPYIIERELSDLNIFTVK